MYDKSTVIVTGASSGIGKATAEKFLAEGYEVVGLDSVPIKRDFQIINCDIAKENQITKAIDYISNRYYDVRYLINCAGVFFHKNRYEIEKMSIDEWTHTININLTGTMLMVKHVIPLMRLASGDKAIVNLSSDQATHPRERNSAYAVSKSGVNCLTKTAARELLTERIRVNAIEAASVETNFIRAIAETDERMRSIYSKENERMPLGLIAAADIADLCFFLCSPSSIHITGQTILVDSGLYL